MRAGRDELTYAEVGLERMSEQLADEPASAMLRPGLGLGRWPNGR
ncbi:hypothetical protein ACGFZB_26575 [Streptomyces cinerochromogenes]|uniref:Uncharacterized protein n=1 Tax=Streptomyces cinerochromogenes TaxID=66422 RepID=A0ABW7BAW3_9ACTN